MMEDLVLVDTGILRPKEDLKTKMVSSASENSHTTDQLHLSLSCIWALSSNIELGASGITSEQLAEPPKRKRRAPKPSEAQTNV